MSLTANRDSLILYKGANYTEDGDYTIPLRLTIDPPEAKGKYSISPDLKTRTGLDFNDSTGVITGTPNEGSSKYTISYTITFTPDKDSFYKDSKLLKKTITIEVRDKIKVKELKTSAEFTNTRVGTRIADITFTTDPSAATGTYSINPDLHDQIGLDFDSKTGAITGIPNKELEDPTAYLVTFSADPDGIYTGIVSIKMKVVTYLQELKSFTLSPPSVELIVGQRLETPTIESRTNLAVLYGNDGL